MRFGLLPGEPVKTTLQSIFALCDNMENARGVLVRRLLLQGACALDVGNYSWSIHFTIRCAVHN